MVASATEGHAELRADAEHPAASQPPFGYGDQSPVWCYLQVRIVNQNFPVDAEI